ncbi:MAG: hypothetical protein RJA70_1765, partial [Pseudomonadota bacterium]
EAVFAEYGRYVYRVLRYFGVPEADLSDLTQEVFIVVHRRLHAFEGRSSLKTWLYRICQRAASDHRKRAHVRREIATAEPCEQLGAAGTLGGEGADGPSGEVERIESRNLLLAALAHLDEDKRVVFVLFEVEGLTMREVCEVVDCPLQTAYSRLHAARKILVEALRSADRGAA